MINICLDYKYNVHAIGNFWAHANIEEGLKWKKRLEENVCSCPYLLYNISIN